MSNIQTIAEKYLETSSDADFTKLYNRLLPGVRKHIQPFIKGFADNIRDMENEILSHTFEKVYTKIGQYNPIYSFSTWVYAIARYAAWAEIARVKHLLFLSNCKTEAGEVIDPLALDDIINKEDYKTTLDIEEREEELLKMELYNKTVEAMNTLGPKHKGIIIDREIHHMKYEELADKYVLPLNTVKSRIRCAREKLKKQLIDYKNDLEME